MVIKPAARVVAALRKFLIFLAIATSTRVVFVDGNACDSVCDCTADQTVVRCDQRDLTTLPDSIPPTVIKLNLSSNQLTQITSGLEGLVSLEELYIDKNKLDLISEDAFSGPHNLTLLSLSNNELSSVTFIGFLKDSQLSYLNLENNAIQGLDGQQILTFGIGKFRSLTVKLGGNTLNCDCKLRWLADLFQAGLARKVEGAVCEKPVNFRDVNLATIDPTSLSCSGDHLCYGCDDESSPVNDESCATILKCDSNYDTCITEVNYSSPSEEDDDNDSDEEVVTGISKSCGSEQSCTDDCEEDETYCKYCCSGSLCNLFLPEQLMIQAEVTSSLATTSPSPTTKYSSTMAAIHQQSTQSPRTTTKDAITSTKMPTSTITSTDTHSTVEKTSTQTTEEERQQIETTITGARPMCPDETLETEKGAFEWVSTPPGMVATLPCPFNTSFQAFRLCLNDLQWQEPDTAKCPFKNEITNSLKELAEKPLSPETANAISQELVELSQDAPDFSATDLALGVTSLESLADFAAKNVSGDEAKNLMNDIVLSTSNLMDSPEDSLLSAESTDNSITRLIQSLEGLSAVKLDASGNQSDSLNIVAPNLALSLKQVDQNSFEGLSFAKLSSPDSQDSDFTDEDVVLSESDDFLNGLGTDQLDLSVELPSTFFGSDNANTSTQIQFILYRQNSLFDALNNLEATSSTVQFAAINSLMVSINVGENKNISDLQDPINLRFSQLETENVENPQCVWWDFNANDGEGDWSSQGCDVATEDDGQVLCQCDHLTNFALLMDIYGQSGEIDEANQLALSIISYIGCGVSMLGLVLTIILFTVFQKARKGYATKVLLNLSIALLLMNVLFIVGSFAVEFVVVDKLCMVVAVLLHYSLLAVMMWMAIEAVLMYILLVKVFKTYYHRFILKLCLVGWGVPAVVVIVTLGVDVNHYGYYNGICWLDRIPFLAAFLAPACLLLVFNAIVFVIVLRQLNTVKNSSKRLSTSSKVAGGSRYTVRTQVKAVVSLTVLLGLTWFLALFAINGFNLVVNYLFAILNSLQGFSVFFFQVLLAEDMRDELKQLFCRTLTETSEQKRKSSGGTRLSALSGSDSNKRMSSSSAESNYRYSNYSTDSRTGLTSNKKKINNSYI